MFRDVAKEGGQWKDWKGVDGSVLRGVTVEEQEQSLITQYHGRTRMDRPAPKRSSNCRATLSIRSRLLYGLVATAVPTAMAQSCISLANSTQCPAFNASSISTDSTLTGLFSFLTNVTDVDSFDTQLQAYIAGAFSEERYQTLIGCSAYNASNTTNYYARYTTSVLCNAIVQNSIDPCDLTGSATDPLCADTCAEYAESEEEIAASNYCGNSSSYAMTQIRADFTNCALPADSLSGTCIEGVTNQPDDCGYASNMGALCEYCASSSPNATDSCCVYSDTETRCIGVVLPVVATSALSSLFTSTSSPTSSATSTSLSTTNRSSGLTGGQIAGVVVGSILGAFALLALVIFACIFVRRRQQNSPANSVFNQPSQARQPQMAFRNDGAASQHDHLDVLPVPGGRVTRMAAIEDASGDDEGNGESPMGVPYSKPSMEGSSPRTFAGIAPPPRRKRSGSLSANSVLAAGAAGEASPGETFSSPDTTQSEQLDFFKDYYSQDEIHLNDIVSTLWAYQPRAGDEFELERGEMLKVLGIWDDGWATGVRVRMHAEDWRGDDKLLRDSGVSGSRNNSPKEHGDVKAFPLVCVCLPQHWKRTIESDSTEGTDGIAEQPSSSL